MCGISGIVSFKEVIDPELIISMTEIINYRGHDDYGYLGFNSEDKNIICFKNNYYNSDVNSNVFFGHRRLSILDLSKNGHQPFSYLNERY
jgi:asparagine synthase (glutamine-hydrolysing)